MLTASRLHQHLSYTMTRNHAILDQSAASRKKLKPLADIYINAVIGVLVFKCAFVVDG